MGLEHSGPAKGMPTIDILRGGGDVFSMWFAAGGADDDDKADDDDGDGDGEDGDDDGGSGEEVHGDQAGDDGGGVDRDRGDPPPKKNKGLPGGARVNTVEGSQAWQTRVLRLLRCCGRVR